MRQALVVVVLVAAGLAGCIGSTDVPPGNATDAGPTTDASVPTFPNGTPVPTTLAYEDCVEQGGSFPVPASAYEDRLPDGFAVAPYSAAGTVDGEPVGATGELVLLGFRCRLPDGATESVAVAYLLVDPPEAWADPDATFGHGLLLSWVTTSEASAAVYEAWGLGPVTGEVTLDGVETPAARAGTMEASADGATLRIDTATEGPATELAGSRLRLFAVHQNGTVTGAMDVDWTALQATLGTGAASGSLGTLEQVPAQPGVGFHTWAFDEQASYVDLPDRDG